eukprot:jgi/Mesvir1/13890/Mv25093-RA.1
MCVLRCELWNLKPGHLAPGTMVLGPPQSGKTTLLRALSRQGPGVSRMPLTGQVLYGGDEALRFGNNLKKLILHAESSDDHIPYLTARETADFAVQCLVSNKMDPGSKPYVTADYMDGKSRTDVILMLMGLLRVADNHVGYSEVRGLSEGERHLLTLAELSCSGPPVLMLDDPTLLLGLADGWAVMQRLRVFVEELGVSCLASFTTATQEVFALFDDVMLLQDGRCTYFGPTADAVSYFSTLTGLPQPAEMSAPEYLMLATQGTISNQLGTSEVAGKGAGGSVRPVPRTAAEFAEAFQASPIYEETRAKITRLNAPRVRLSADVTERRQGTSFLQQFWACFKRHGMVQARAWENWVARTLVIIFIGFLAGTLFFNLEYNLPGALDRFGLIFFILTVVAGTSWGKAPELHLQRRVMYKQARVGMYKPAAYFLAVVAVDCLLRMPGSFIFTSLFYWLAGLNAHDHGAHFFYAVLMVYWIEMAADACVRLLAMLCKSLELAQVVSAFSLVYILFSAGFIAPKNSVLDGWLWLYWSNPGRYYFQGMSINEFADQNWCADEPMPARCPLAPNPVTGASSGQAALALFDITTDSNLWRWMDLLIVFGFWVLFVALGALVISVLRWDVVKQSNAAMRPLMRRMHMVEGGDGQDATTTHGKGEGKGADADSDTDEKEAGCATNGSASDNAAATGVVPPGPDATRDRGELGGDADISEPPEGAAPAPIPVPSAEPPGAQAWLFPPPAPSTQVSEDARAREGEGARGKAGEEQGQAGREELDKGAFEEIKVAPMEVATSVTAAAQVARAIKSVVDEVPPIPDALRSQVAAEHRGIQVSPSGVAAGSIAAPPVSPQPQLYGGLRREVLAFVDIGYQVPSPSKGAFTGSHPHHVIRGVCGYATPGKLTAVLGPSGCGTTTLLDVIAGQKTVGTCVGSVFVSGLPLGGHTPAASSSRVRRLVAYAEQDVGSQTARQTVREAVAVSAELRLPENISKAERRAKVEETMEMMGIAAYANELVGPVEGGLPRDIRRRLVVAIEVVACLPILLLDEPLAGLDYPGALDVMLALQRVAACGRSLVVTMPRPSPAFFAMCDYALLLDGGGRQAYFGPAGELPTYITTALHVPGRGGAAAVPNIADCLHLMYNDERRNGPGQLASVWETSPRRLRLQEELAEEPFGKAATWPTIPPKYAAPFWKQCVVLLRRHMLMFYRNPWYNLLRYVYALAAGLVLGSYTYNIPRDQAGLYTRLGLFFNTTIIKIPSILAAANPIFDMRTTAFRETKSLMYSNHAYNVAITLVEVPFFVLEMVVFFFSFYFLAGLNREADRLFLSYLLVSMFGWFLLQNGQMMGLQGSSVVWMNHMAPVVGLILAVTAGFIIRQSQIPDYWIWLYWANPVHYYLEAALSNEVHGVPYQCQFQETIGCLPFEHPDGDSFLRFLSWNYDHLWRDVGILAAFLVIFTTVKGFVGPVIRR